MIKKELCDIMNIIIKMKTVKEKQYLKRLKKWKLKKLQNNVLYVLMNIKLMKKSQCYHVIIFFIYLVIVNGSNNHINVLFVELIFMIIY